MKAKPILIIFSILLLITVVALFVRSRTMVKPQKNEVYQFLILFNSKLQSGSTDSLLNDFEINKKREVLVRLVNVLANKTGMKGNEAPLFKLALDIDKSNIRILNNELAEASIPVNFTNDSVPPQTSILKFKVRRITAHNYKIVQVDANKMMTDYLAYSNLVKGKTLTDKDIYSPATLQAFLTSKQLTTKYDTVVWFAHFNNKTFYYVVKGKWDQDLDVYHYKDTVIGPYKMGLVSPDLKEIIPPEYDLIHNISGTFPDLVEVEKGEKKGFFDLTGKIVIPVNYDQVFPIEDDVNLAVLRNGDDYFYLKKDMSVSDKVDLKINDFLSKIRGIGGHSNLYTNALSVVTEYNSREKHGAVYVPPSYLADLNMTSKLENFKNPLRNVTYEDVHENYNIGFSNKINDADGWLEASFYAIRDYYLGGRSEFYDKKNILIVDKKRNRVFAQDIATDYSPGDGDGESPEGTCDVDNIKTINDSLFEVKSGAILYANMYDSTKTIVEGSYYHYLTIKNNKLTELPNARNFGFTKYIKMDDSYLNGCYIMQTGNDYSDKTSKKTVSHLTPEILRYIKNEIYADYGYKFKDNRWQAVFQEMPNYGYDPTTQKPKEANVTVDDSLTAIDKYNINWINQKLRAAKPNTLAAK